MYPGRTDTVEIITERLLLREFVAADLPALVTYQADPRYAEFWPEEAPPGQSRQLLDRFIDWATERPRRNYQLAVAQIDLPHEVMGSCGLRDLGFDATTAEFGIELAPQSWGHGYATEAARAILAFGFRELGLLEVRGVSVTENWRVTEMVSRLGFTRLGRRKVKGRVALTNGDRWFLVQLYHWFPSILGSLVLIKPETVVRWHRAGFRFYWRWKSRSRGGRPRIDTDLRALIRQMSIENQLWGAPRIHGELLSWASTSPNQASPNT
jgi:RimJ/RimL family protein N-acetyltransferase